MTTKNTAKNSTPKNSITRINITAGDTDLANRANEDDDWPLTGGPLMDTFQGAVKQFALKYECGWEEALIYMLAMRGDRTDLSVEVMEQREQHGELANLITDLVIEVEGGCVVGVYGRDDDLGVILVDRDSEEPDSRIAVEPLYTMENDLLEMARAVEGAE